MQLPLQAGMNRHMKKQSNPRLISKDMGIQIMMMDNLLQTNLDLQHPIGQDLLLHPTSRKPERVIGEHMKQEKSQVIQHIQESGIGLVW